MMSGGADMGKQIALKFGFKTQHLKGFNLQPHTSQLLDQG